jgi:NAD(P)H-dependent FMN reductase
MKIKIILGSTRPARFGIQVAEWILNEGKKIENFDVELIDLKDYPMPFFEEDTGPSRITTPYTNTTVAKFTQKIAEGDGFIIISPEYNHAPSAVIKNAMDYVYKEWNNKPVGFASYGSVGGTRAIEQLRLIAIELQMAPIRNSIQLVNFWAHLDEAGKLKTEDFQNQIDPFFSQLKWWCEALKTAKEKDKN